MISLNYLYAIISPSFALSRIRKSISEGKYRDALRRLHVVIRVRPRNSGCRVLAGMVCFNLKRLSSAHKHLSHVELTDPQYGQAQYWMGCTSKSLGRMDDAVACFSRATNNGVNNEAVWLGLAQCYHRKKEVRSMRNSAEKVLNLNPQSIGGYFLLGEAQRYLGDIKLAQKAYRRVLELDPNMFFAVESMAWMLLDTYGNNKALDFVQEEIESTEISNKSRYLGLYGDLLVRDYQYDKAETIYREALAVNSGKDNLELAKLWTNLGVLQRQISRVEEASECFDNALTIEPNFKVAKWHRSLIRLFKYEFSEAWEDYEFRKISRDTSVRVSSISDWAGPGALNSNLLVYAEQGLGDEIMFASCIPELKKDVVQCVIECSAQLVELYEQSFPWAKIVAHDKSLFSLDPVLSKFPEINCVLPVGSLPKFYRANDKWPPCEAYLTSLPEKVLQWQQRLDQLGKGLNVGISWRGGSEATGTSMRSISLSKWAGILEIPGCTFISMQYGEVNDEIAQVSESFGINVIHWPEAIENYHETAALTKALDLVITIPTSLVHLAGALGSRALVLVPFAPEWRFGAIGKTMRWHHSVELFRQKKMGVWDDVLLDVANEIINIKSKYDPLEKERVPL